LVPHNLFYPIPNIRQATLPSTRIISVVERSILDEQIIRSQPGLIKNRWFNGRAAAGTAPTPVFPHPAAADNIACTQSKRVDLPQLRTPIVWCERNKEGKILSGPKRLLWVPQLQRSRAVHPNYELSAGCFGSNRYHQAPLLLIPEIMGYSAHTRAIHMPIKPLPPFAIHLFVELSLSLCSSFIRLQMLTGWWVGFLGDAIRDYRQRGRPFHCIYS
jgi:hypothetical protein